MESTDSPSEKAIEDILARNPGITEDILEIESGHLVLIDRQEVLPSGRSDLVFRKGDELILIELKVVPAVQDHVDQIQDYIPYYKQKIQNGSISDIDSIRPVLLVPSISEEIDPQEVPGSVEIIEFSITDTLTQFQDTVFSNLRNFEAAGAQTGVNHLSLVNGLIKFIGDSEETVTVQKCADNYDEVGKGETSHPRNRVRKFLRITSALDLTRESDNELVLTERGIEYRETMDETVWKISRGQADIVIDHLYTDPFSNQITFSLVALLDAIFEVSKNAHPVSRQDLQDYYAVRVGKSNDWSDSTREDAVKWLGNYLEELGLIKEVEQKYYLLPEGLKLISYFQIDQGKEMIRSIGS
jgi:hypothetical protein